MGLKIGKNEDTTENRVKKEGGWWMQSNGTFLRIPGENYPARAPGQKTKEK